jgi:tetratricopeptide (TPR) repeat protein
LEERSFPLYRRVIELDPVNRAAYYHLVLASWGEPQQAIEVYRTYVRRFGEDDALQFWVAGAYDLLGNHEKAREYYEKALEAIGPHSEVGYTTNYLRVNSALFYDAIGERGRAEDICERGIEDTRFKLESYPDNVATRLFLASFLGLMGDHDSFLAESRRALEVTDINPYEILLVAAVHARRGESERAVDLLRRTLRSGRVGYHWRALLRMARASPDSPPYNEFLEEYEAEKQRLSELY